MNHFLQRSLILILLILFIIPSSQAQQTLFRTDFSGSSAAANNLNVMGPGFGALPEADITFGNIPSNNGFDGATDGNGAIIVAEPGELWGSLVHKPTGDGGGVRWSNATFVKDNIGFDYNNPPTDDNPPSTGGGTPSCPSITTPIPNLLSGATPLELVWIEPGTFMMGSPYDERSWSSGETQHQVTLTQGFYMGKYEVTQAQWQAVMGNNPSGFSGKPGFQGATVPWTRHFSKWRFFT